MKNLKLPFLAYIKLSTNPFFGAWSLLLVHVPFTSNERPKGFQYHIVHKFDLGSVSTWKIIIIIIKWRDMTWHETMVAHCILLACTHALLIHWHHAYELTYRMSPTPYTHAIMCPCIHVPVPMRTHHVHVPSPPLTSFKKPKSPKIEAPNTLVVILTKT